MADEPVTEAAEAVNQGATGDAPPATEPETGGDAFAERPEAFVGAAFAGGFVLALLMRRWVS